MSTEPDLLNTARAEALHVSSISADRTPTREEVSAAIRYAIRLHGGVRGCAGEVAAAYGEHPEIAAPRMRWALRTVAVTYPARPRHRWSRGGVADLGADSGEGFWLGRSSYGAVAAAGVGCRRSTTELDGMLA